MGRQYLNPPLIESVCESGDVELALQTCLNNKVIIPKPGPVREYLVEHTDLIIVVVYACCVASEHFNSRAQLSLEIFSDHEINDKYLSLYIRQETYDENILKSIKELRSKYNKVLLQCSGEFHMTTDYLSPKG